MNEAPFLPSRPLPYFQASTLKSPRGRFTTSRETGTPVTRERPRRIYGIPVACFHPPRFPPFLLCVSSAASLKSSNFKQHSQSQLSRLTGSRYPKGTITKGRSNWTSSDWNLSASEPGITRESTSKTRSVMTSPVCTARMTPCFEVPQEASHVGCWWASMLALCHSDDADTISSSRGTQTTVARAR